MTPPNNQLANSQRSGSIGSLLESLPEFLAEVSTKLTATSLAIATTDLKYIPAILGVALIELIAAGKNYRSTLAFARLEEFAGKLETDISRLNTDVVRSFEFAALCKTAFEEFIRESMEEKRNMIVRYVATAGSRAWDPSHDHSKILSTLERLSPSYYVAFLDIVKAVDASMQWDLENHGKITFQYGIGVVLAKLEELPINTLALRREVTLDSTLRSLSALDLIHVKDSSASGIGGSSTHTEVINVTPLGRQIISFVSPELDFVGIRAGDGDSVQNFGDRPTA